MKIMAGMNRMAGIVGVCVLCLGASLMGGCQGLKQKNALLMQENENLREKNSELQTSLGAADSQRQALQNEVIDRRAARQTGGGFTDPTGKRPRQDMDPGAGEKIFVLASDGAFDAGSATLKAGAKKELDPIASQLKSKYGNNTVRVEGYTDADPIKKSKWPSNDALSQARAEAVEKYLVSKGVESSRIQAVGMGSANPKATKKASRRVEIVVADTR